MEIVQTSLQIALLSRVCLDSSSVKMVTVFTPLFSAMPSLIVATVQTKSIVKRTLVSVLNSNAEATEPSATAA